MFGFPVFNADLEVARIYNHNRKVFKKLKKELPNYFYSFPVKKKEIIDAILSNRKNLKKIIRIVHYEVRKKMNDFLRKNKHKKLVVLDIPLLLENKINKKKDILIFIESKKPEILKRLKKRKNFNMKILNNFKRIQLSLVLKKKKFFYGDESIMENETKTLISDLESKKSSFDQESDEYNKIAEQITTLKRDTKIFDEAKKVYEKEYPYKIDGLVFTPRSLKVGQEPNREKKNMFDGRWYNCFKWKPPDENTIDFLVKFKKHPENGKL